VQESQEYRMRGACDTSTVAFPCYADVQLPPVVSNASALDTNFPAEGITLPLVAVLAGSVPTALSHCCCCCCCCQALLHLPSTSAYDVWSAACCIYEAATGRLLFPVEQVAAVR
jgi:hypothetical protein